ncbi:uncharacterized protein GGS22DRAFT_196020 [Annulohypoxylon maeteangense]|uniref:uncharacterized protein n=1 Tax=Annulohypoxylon maeteangense TaxID=1927788 RepID=UPI002007D338|nr:uncharacterized protein GGS22DRAFT_196020 [Annulohypoxylon maeteangense]KAI0882317.1 hypothetical protein GGS22DRAFT_196020 [Annulohypoxylon maeteangense]
MPATKPLTLLGLATLLLQVSGYKLTAYKEKGCKGEVQQTIEDTKYGDYCQYFKDKAASIKVEGSSKDEQWIFFNNWCGKDAQVGSFQGDGCMTMGNTKLKAVNNILPEGSSKKKRASAGTVRTWKNTDCSGSSTNEMGFIGENLPVTLNSVDSIKVSDVPKADIAFACSDSDCHVENQVATLENGKCVNVKGKKVKSAMVIGVPTPPRKRDDTSERRHSRSLISEARALDILKRDNGINCDASNGPDYKDALKVGDNWQGKNGLECCCHVPGGSNSKTSGSAKASINDNIRCPADPSGMPPPPTTCPLNCNGMRSYIYAIATQCKNKDGKTGGTATLSGDGKITLGHS